MNYQTVASQGRYGDTTLVHMTPQEVAGLNALGAAYGRPMTINPTTGYPEAFNLRNLLPTIIGAGLNIASGGTLTPLMAGMITGAGYTVATGDIRKGLGAGFGAAGGAGLGSGLTAAGSTAMPVQGASTMAENFARAGEGFKALGSGEGINAFMGTPATSAVPATGVGGIGGLAKSTAMSLAPQAMEALEPKPIAPGEPSYIRPYSLDIENTSSTPYDSSSEREQLKYRFTAGTPYRAAQGGQVRYQEGGSVDGVSPSVANVYQNIADVQRMAGLPMIDVPSVRSPMPRQAMAQPAPLSYTGTNYNIGLPKAEESKIYQEIQKQQTIKDKFDNLGFGSSMRNQGVIGYLESGEPVFGPREENGYAEGGLAGLREGRFLRGDGDGMSDEIEASIEGEVDALLSDGEFVIPADVVSHLGNGSSEAGAKVLYEMMDRVRKERTGKEEQAKEIPVEKVIPA